jgi:hypothetical protein
MASDFEKNKKPERFSFQLLRHIGVGALFGRISSASASTTKIKEKGVQIGQEIFSDNYRQLYSVKKPFGVETRELGRKLLRLHKNRKAGLIQEMAFKEIEKTIHQKLSQNKEFTNLLNNILTGKLQIDIDKMNKMNSLLTPNHLSRFEEKLLKLPHREEIARISDFVNLNPLQPASIKTTNLIKNIRGGIGFGKTGLNFVKDFWAKYVGSVFYDDVEKELNNNPMVDNFLSSLIGATTDSKPEYPVKKGLLGKAKDKIMDTIRRSFSRQRTWAQFAQDMLKDSLAFIIQHPILVLFILLVLQLRDPLWDLLIKRDLDSFLDKILDILNGEEPKPKPKPKMERYRPERGF